MSVVGHDGEGVICFGYSRVAAGGDCMHQRIPLVSGIQFEVGLFQGNETGCLGTQYQCNVSGAELRQNDRMQQRHERGG
jgi:hypothetical protein